MTGTCGVGFGSITLEAGVLPQKSQLELANRAIALFANNDFRDAFFSALRIVNFITINKTNQVRILLNGA